MISKSHASKMIPYKANWLIAPVITALAIVSNTSSAADSPIATDRDRAESTAQPSASKSKRYAGDEETFLIKLDNRKGTKKLVFREYSPTRQCVTHVDPEVATVLPGETAEIRLDLNQGFFSACGIKKTQVLWTVEATQEGEPVLNYKMQFNRQNGVEHDGHLIMEWFAQIQSSNFNTPGTPYAAACGGFACLNKWGLYNNNSAVIAFYEKKSPPDDKATQTPRPTVKDSPRGQEPQ